MAAPCLPAAQLSMLKNESENPSAPRYQFFYGGEKCGAMWRRTPKGGGESYLSGHIESPVFPGGKLDVAAFVAKEGGEGLMDLVWNPPREARGGREAVGGGQEADGPF